MKEPTYYTHITEYRMRKASAQYKAIEWQAAFENRLPSWGDIAEASAYFEKLGRRYGLMKEFRENGII